MLFNKSLVTGVLVVSILFTACNSQVYNNKSYLGMNNITGKKVAILPVEVEFTGRLPKDYSIDKKISGEATESTMIQEMLYSQYLYKSKRSRNEQKAVNLINIEQVNSRLKNSDIGIRESWAMNPDSLGKLLGADMVLKVRVKKDRIMSESASFGIGVATTVIGAILNGNSNTGVSGSNSSAKTYTINLDATLSDVKTGTVISKFSDEENASWSRSPESIVKETNKKIVRKGPIYTN